MLRAIERLVPRMKATGDSNEETDSKGKTHKGQAIKVYHPDTSNPDGTAKFGSPPELPPSPRYLGTASFLQVPSRYPTPEAVSPTNSGSPTLCDQDPSGLSESKLRDQRGYFTDDEEAAYALFKVQKEVNHKLAAHTLKSFADSVFE